MEHIPGVAKLQQCFSRDVLLLLFYCESQEQIVILSNLWRKLQNPVYFDESVWTGIRKKFYFSLTMKIRVTFS